MKKLYYIFLIPFFVSFYSCDNRKAEVARLKAQNDSLRSVGSDKDSNISEFVATFNEVEANLDSIKRVERVISMSTKSGEVQSSRKEQIKSDIAYIYDLLQKNRKLVADLTAKLSKSNRHVAELQKMINNLNKSIDEKNTQIAQLSDELGKMNIEVKDLTVKVSKLKTNVNDLSADNQKKQADIDAKTEALNTAYYVIGTNRELKEKKIITGAGGFIGLGRTKNVLANLNMSDFTKVDITKVNEIPVLKKKVTILTTHPTGSYKLEGTNSVEKIIILNAKDFWSASKVLVVIAK
jgi:predicted  nucleic acid-binding Zn-ribbon protein